MIKLQRWSVLLVAALLTSVLCLAGCGEQANNTNNNETAQQQILPYQGETLLVNSGAGFSKVMDAVGEAFTEKYGAQVNFNYANMAQLLSQLEISKQGDALVCATINDMEIAMEKGFTDEYVEVAYHTPAIAVPKGNPAGITGLEDLAKPDVKLILGDKEATAIGKKGTKIFEKNNLNLTDIENNVVSRTTTVNEVVTNIGLKQADAGLVFEDNVTGIENIEMIPIPKEQNVIDRVPVCVLNFTQNAELAQAFVDFIVSEEGKAIFTERGFEVIE